MDTFTVIVIAPTIVAALVFLAAYLRGKAEVEDDDISACEDGRGWEFKVRR